MTNQSSTRAPRPPLSRENADDVALMTAIHAGDDSALARLYDRHSPVILGLCLRILKDRAEAEDLTIEVFWEIWNCRHRYNATRSAPLTYLLRVARSRIIDRVRARQSKRQLQPPAPGDGAARNAHPGPLESVLQGEEQARIARALERLTSEQRAAVEFSFFDALSHTEIADRLGEPLGTVKSRIRQAIARLRDLLAGAQE